MIIPGTKLAHAGRGLGYKPDRRHLFGLPVADARATLSGLPVPPAGSESLLVDKAVVSILDQGAAPFCVSHGTTQAVRTRQVLGGAVSPPLGSRLWVMYLAHAIENDVEGFDGAIVADAFEAIQKLGLPPEDVWPYSDSADGPFKTKPPAEVFRAAYDAIAPWRATRILSEGDQRIDDIRTALAAGLPVVFGTQVTEALCGGVTGPDFTVDVPTIEPLAGGHCMMLSGFEDANRRARVINSWGPGVLDQGRFWLTYDYLKWVFTEDLWVVDFEGGRA